MEEWKGECYTPQESKDFNLLKNKLAPSFPEKFYDFKEQKYGKFFDVSNLSRDGQYYILELKCRKENTLRFEDCYIEMKKYLNLVGRWLDDDAHPIPLYINFFGDDPDIIYIWDLRKKMKCTAYLNWAVKGHTEPQQRIGLLWSDGVRLKRNADGFYKIDK